MKSDYNKAIDDFKSALRFDYAEARPTTFLNVLNMLGRLEAFPAGKRKRGSCCFMGYMYRYLGIYDRRKFNEAIYYSKEAIKHNVRLSDAYVTLGVINRKQGRQGEALNYLNKAIELEPGNVPAHQNIAWIHSERGDFPNAILAMRKMVEIEPDNYHNSYRLAHFLSYKTGNYHEALIYAQKACALNRNVKSLLLLGHTYYYLGKYDEAIQSYRQVPEADHQAALAYEGIGYCYFQKKDYLNSVDYFKKSLEADNSSFNAYLSFASAYVNLNKLDEAATVYETLIAKRPYDSQPYSYLGVLYFRKGNFGLAVSSFKKALELNPDDQISRGMLSYALRNSKDSK